MTSPDNSSSRGLAQKIKDRLLTKFKASVTEIPTPGSNELVIGVAIVGYDEAKTKERVNQIIRHLQEWSSVELVNDEVEIMQFDDLEMERDFEKYNP